MHFGVNLKMKKPALSCCFTWIAFVELNFTVLNLTSVYKENVEGLICQ